MLEMPLKYFSSLLNIGLTLLYIKNEIPVQSDLMALIFCKFASLVNVWNVHAYSLWLFLNCCNVTLKYLFKGSVYFASEVVKLYLDPSFLLRSNQEPCLLWGQSSAFVPHRSGSPSWPNWPLHEWGVVLCCLYCTLPWLLDSPLTLWSTVIQIPQHWSITIYINISKRFLFLMLM